MPADEQDLYPLGSLRSAVPGAARMERLRHTLVASASPVRPLPSNASLMLLCVAGFAVLAIALALPVGFFGFTKLTGAGRFVEYVVLLLLATMLAGSVVEQMIPGSRRTISPVAGACVAILLLAVTAALMFPVVSPHNFVRQGIPCLRMGSLCALPAAVLTWALMRKGFMAHPVSATVAGGAFAGLVGVGVLALHCPVFDAGHIITWHLAVIAVTTLSGALLGGLSRFR